MRLESSLENDRRVLRAGIRQTEDTARIEREKHYLACLLAGGATEHVTLWTAVSGRAMWQTKGVLA
jgi:hypothetical protein